MTLAVQHTIRALSRQRLYAVMVLLIIGIGLGANAVLVAVADALFLQPLPYRDGERMRSSMSSGRRGQAHGWMARRRRVPAFDAVAGYRSGEGTIGVAGEPVRVRMAAVTPSFFAVFRDAPLRGRTFASPGTAGTHGVVIGERLAEHSRRRRDVACRRRRAPGHPRHHAGRVRVPGPRRRLDARDRRRQRVLRRRHLPERRRPPQARRRDYRGTSGVARAGDGWQPPTSPTMRSCRYARRSARGWPTRRGWPNGCRRYSPRQLGRRAPRPGVAPHWPQP